VTTNQGKNMTNKILRKAILTALGTAAMAGVSTQASATSTTMYNLYRANWTGAYADPNNINGPAGAIYTATSTTPCAPCNNLAIGGADNGSGNSTDGWVWDANPTGSDSPAFNNTSLTADPNRPGWTGIGGSATPTLTTPFGYNGRVTLNWAMELNGGGSGQISNADAISRYSQSADIDTAKGAWSDVAGNPPGSASGWKHDLDWGLFKTDVTGPVTLSATGVNQTGTNFGFTIFKGQNSSTAAGYSHHGGWNGGGNNTGGAPTTANIPGQTGFTLADMVAWSVGGTTPSNLNTISFNAVAGQVYSIALGGYRNGAWGDTNDGYVLNVSQVPVPAAVWLFGSALAGMGIIGRRKEKLA
jgi:hypothetical protein